MTPSIIRACLTQQRIHTSARLYWQCVGYKYIVFRNQDHLQNSNSSQIWVQTIIVHDVKIQEKDSEKPKSRWCSTDPWQYVKYVVDIFSNTKSLAKLNAQYKDGNGICSVGCSLFHTWVSKVHRPGREFSPYQFFWSYLTPFPPSIIWNV